MNRELGHTGRKRRWLSRLWLAGGILLGLGLGWLALRGVDWRTVGSSLGKVSWAVWIPAVAAVIVSTFLQAVRWKLLLPGEAVSTVRLFFVRNAGLGMNNITVARGILGEASELVMLSRSDHIPGGKGAASIFMSHFLDFAVTSAFLLAGFIVLPELSGMRPAVLTVLVAAGVLVVAVMLAKRISRLPFLSRVKALGSSLHGVHHLRCRHYSLALSITLTIMSWLLLGMAAWLVSQALGIQLPFWMMSILLVGIGIFAGAIPAGPGKLGTYEFATVYTLGLFAVDKSDAMTFALVTHAVLVLPSILIGLPVISRERRTFEAASAEVGGLCRRALSLGRRKPCPEPAAPHP